MLLNVRRFRATTALLGWVCRSSPNASIVMNGCEEHVQDLTQLLAT
jgi:hypothetical protein